MSTDLSAEAIHLSNEPSPFDAVRINIEDLFDQAKGFLDGEPVTSQAVADEIGALMAEIRQAEKAADEARKLENKPFDEGKAAVQERYLPLIGNTTRVKGKTVLALEACKSALAPFLKKLDDEKREAERIAREAAEAKAREAAEAARAAASDDLAAKEAAEALIEQARKAEAAAKRATNDRAHATGGARATTLRTVYRAEMVDPHIAAAHYWRTNPAAFNAVLQKLADDDVRAGKRQVPGFDVIEDRVVV